MVLITDNLKIALLCMIWFHISTNIFLYIWMRAKAMRLENEMNRIEGQEKLNQAKERIRKKAEDEAQRRVLMYVRGEKPEPPPESQPLRAVSEAAAKMADDYLAGRPIEDEVKKKKRKARAVGLKQVADVVEAATGTSLWRQQLTNA